MALPMQFPRAVRGNLDVFEPKSDVKSNTFTRKRRRTRYAGYKRDATRSREDSLLLEKTELKSDDSGFLGERSHSRTHPRQIRRDLFTSETLGSSGTRKYGRLVGRQSNPTAIGENVNQRGQAGNGNGVGDANANGNPNPPPPTAEEGEEEESESESESESDSEDEEGGEEDAGEEEENELEDKNKEKLSPSETGDTSLGASGTAAAIVTDAGASTIAPTGEPCDPSVSQPSVQCESPAPDLLQPSQKAAIATGATVGGIVALLVLAFCFMRSRHGSDYSGWPCVRRYRRKRLRLNSKTESGITILPPPPFQKEDPWIITRDKPSWLGRKPPLASEMKDHPRGPSKLQNKPLIRRLLGEPLESNPVTHPPSISSPLHPEIKTRPVPEFNPSRASNLFSPRDNNRLTISTRSSQALPEDEQPEISDTRSVRSNTRPQNSRRLPGVSYFSWTVSSPTTTGPNKYQSFMSRSNKRETTTTVDSEPARFRTISSWVNQQYKRVNGTNDQLPPPPVPKKDNTSANAPLSARAADSPLKQSMEQNTDSPTKPPPLLSKPTPPHPPIRATPLRPTAHNTPSAQAPSETPIPPVPPLPSSHSLPPPPPTPLKPRADNKYHQRTVSVSTNETAPTASTHRKNASSTASSLPTIFKHHPGDKVEIN